MPLIENTTGIRLGVMAQDAMAALWEKVQFIKKLNMGFDLQPGQKDNSYNVTVIDEGTLQARTRANDNDSVTDDEAGVSKVEITTTQIYTSQPFGQQFMDSTSGRFMDKFVDAQAGKLANAIEELALKEYAKLKAVAMSAGAVATNKALGTANTTIKFSDFQTAKLTLNNAYHNDMLSVMLSNVQMKDALALSEFKEALTVPESNQTGEASIPMYGFDPQRTTLTRNGNPNSTSGVLAANIASTTVTQITASGLNVITGTFPVTNPDQDAAIRAGQVIQVNSAEYMLVHKVVYTSSSAATIDVVRGWWGSTPATATAGQAVDVVDSRTGLFYKGSELVYAFARQAEFNNFMGEKVTVSDPDNAMFLSMYKEHIPGKNGMFRIVTSIDIGFNVIRDSAIVPIVLPL